MDYQAKLTELLLATARQNASDLHIGVGQPPTLRLDGALIPLTGEQIVTPEIAEGHSRRHFRGRSSARNERVVVAFYIKIE